MLSMIGCEKPQQEEPERREGDQQNGNVNVKVKVMTDEQFETLRKQIVVYSIICDQLVEMHNNLTAHQYLAVFSRESYAEAEQLRILQSRDE